MPNWVENTLCISGTKSKISDLAESIKAQEGNKDGGVCTAILPMPQELLESTGPEPEWYIWRSMKWGTKWDFQPIDDLVIAEVDEDTSRIHLGFDTAWAPPTALYDELVDRGFEVRAQYHEPGNGFIGEYDNGDDESYDYEDAPDSLLKKLGVYDMFSEEEDEDE